MGEDRSIDGSRPGDTAASVAVSLAKRLLRSRCRQTRDDLGEAHRQQASRRICEHILAWSTFQSAGIVLTYLPMRGEVDLRPLFEQAPQVQWGIPRVVDLPESHLLFHAYRPDRLVRHRYGMLEPDPSAPLVAPEEADLILVPGLAFDWRGFRLGYGGGYYDRLLGKLTRPATLGICYQALLLDEIPHGAHDVAVTHLVTEAAGVVVRRDAA
jgi:5-formyltetrahydrofolate cyclo-ligase